MVRRTLNNKVGTANLAARFSLFGTYVPANAYPTGVSPADYWPTVFAPPPANVTTRVASNTTNGTESWYTVRYGTNDAPITPTRAVLIRPNYYRFYFRVNQGGVSATGEVRAGSRVLASRIVEKQMTTSNDESYIDIELPSFARNFVFRNQTTNKDGRQLYFAGGESFNGPVHTNGTPGFYKLNGETPVFSDDFTSCAANGTYVGYSSPPTQAELQQTFTGGSPTFGVSCIGMPDNSYNQLRAAYGGNVGETAPVTCAELAGKWGLKVGSSCKSVSGTALSKNQEYDAIPAGVYYSKGNPTLGNTGSPNIGNTWNSEISENGGGLYIKGDVKQLKLSVQLSGTNVGKQIIEITPAPTQALPLPPMTRFEEQADGTWVVKVGGVVTKTLTGTFNGMIYVDGDIADMRGNGTTTNGVPNPDIAAASQLTVTSTGKVIIKDDLTYAVNPAHNPGATNVLGIYSSGDRCDRDPSTGIPSCGSILVDGGIGKDVNIDASVMASHKDQGFGAVNFNQILGLLDGRKVQINLTGGVIEDKSQTVGTIGDPGTEDVGGGYARTYKYDQRFKDGIVKPPFFPERTAQWRVEAQRFQDDTSSVWQTVAKTVAN